MQNLHQPPLSLPVFINFINVSTKL